MKKTITLLLILFSTVVFSQHNRLWLNLTKETDLVGQTLIAYTTGATNGYDQGIDALYVNDSQTALTSLIDNQEYVIQGRSLPFTNTDVVPLGFKTSSQGSYTITLSNFDGLFIGYQPVYLKDNLTGLLTNLKISNYTFTTTAGIFNERFEIVYVNTVLETSDKGRLNKNVFVIIKDQNLRVYTKEITIDKVEVFDLMGRLISSTYDINNDFVEIKNITQSNEVQIINIYTDIGRISKKIITR